MVELFGDVSDYSLAFGGFWNGSYLSSDFIPEQPARASRTDSPRIHFLRVAPDEIAERAFVWDLLRSRDHTDLVQRADFRAQAAVDAQHLAVDDGCKREKVEHLAAGFPDRCVSVLGLAFLVEAVNLGDLARLVVSTYQGDSVGISAHGEVSFVGVA